MSYKYDKKCENKIPLSTYRPLGNKYYLQRELILNNDIDSIKCVDI